VVFLREVFWVHVHVTCGCGLVLLWWQCDTLCTSGFVDDDGFAHSGHMARLRGTYCQCDSASIWYCLYGICWVTHRGQNWGWSDDVCDWLVLYVLSVAQKYLSFMFKPEEKVTVMKFKGLHHVDTKSMDAATYLDPKLYPGMAWLSHVPGNIIVQFTHRISAVLGRICPFSLLNFLGRMAVLRTYVDAAYCYWLSRVVCRSVGLSVCLSH